ncbi:EamA family transporter [Tessaracoccus defluvii]|uniref:EamA family transporter n=2 Tax=Tessaracoccus defluvii TaxID=1285901 RepID=A0A7H0H8I1_9ACTN|nr:EamA family transporter [Tessaracoccus defluvii]QNP56847.1 EamA family transporter [Tessaracoccus defluvii]
MSRMNPVVLVLIAIASVQFGASLAKGVFDAAGPATLAFLRVGIATLVLLAVARPRLRGRTLRDWAVVLAYGLCLTGMNTAIYFSFARIPIGVAVTLEFIGPLALGLIGSRRLLDLVWVGLAAAGVVMLGALPVGIDLAGAALALLAGALWAGYIALAGPVGRRWEDLSALTVGNGVGALLLAVPAIVLAGDAFAQPRVWGIMALVALLSTVIPYALELTARRSIRASTFGILMSLEPAAAALFALILLGEVLGPVELAAMACVIVASVGAIRSARPAPQPAGTTV